MFKKGDKVKLKDPIYSQSYTIGTIVGLYQGGGVVEIKWRDHYIEKWIARALKTAEEPNDIIKEIL